MAGSSSVTLRSAVKTAINQLEAFLNEVDAMERSRRLSATDAEALRTSIENLIASLSS